jgi:hypothetical protein
MKKEKDKRLIIPKDAFEEEASEGLGRLNKDEAAEDLRDLEGRMAKQLHDIERGTARRLRKPIRVWIPAAAAVIIILIASTVYIALFRDRQPATPATAMVEESKKDTIMIAMAEPLSRDEPVVKINAKAKDEVTEMRYVAAVVVEEAAVAEEVKDETDAEVEANAEVKDEMIIKILEADMLAEEVIVTAMPERAKAAEGIPAGRAETRAAKKEAVTQRDADYRSAGPDRPPQPAGGMTEMNSWIRSNIRYPAETPTRTRQLVIVSFKVRSDSTLYDLKSESTPGAPFTEEAFRLLREGPHWAPAVRNGVPVEETVRVSLLFK